MNVRKNENPTDFSDTWTFVRTITRDRSLCRLWRSLPLERPGIDENWLHSEKRDSKRVSLILNDSECSTDPSRPVKRFPSRNKAFQLLFTHNHSIARPKCETLYWKYWGLWNWNDIQDSEASFEKIRVSKSFWTRLLNTEWWLFCFGSSFSTRYHRFEHLNYLSSSWAYRDDCRSETTTLITTLWPQDQVTLISHLSVPAFMIWTFWTSFSVTSTSCIIDSSTQSRMSDFSPLS